MDGSRRATLRNRRFIRPLYKDLKRHGNPNLQPLETTVSPPLLYTDPGQETSQDDGLHDAGQANEGIDEQAIKQEEVQPLARKLDHNLAGHQEDFEEKEHFQNTIQVNI